MSINLLTPKYLTFHNNKTTTNKQTCKKKQIIQTQTNKHKTNRNGSAILSVIVDRLDTPSFSIINADFCERCYKLIYRLCADATTGFATMAFLRATEFFMKQSRFLSRFSDLIRDDQTGKVKTKKRKRKRRERKKKEK